MDTRTALSNSLKQIVNKYSDASVLNMPERKFNEFEQIIIRSGNELGAAVLLILAWIAASDGTIDKKEIKKLSDISSAAKYAQEIEPLLRLVKNRNINALQLACEIVNRNFRGDKANLFIEMAIGMAISDGYLLPTENHILRFLADLLGIGNSGLNALFVDSTFGAKDRFLAAFN